MPEKENEEKTSGKPRVRALNFTKSYATNVYCGLTEHDFRIEFMNEKYYDDEDEEWVQIVDSMVILSDLGAKKLYLKLKEAIEVYEKEKGKINVDVDQKTY